MPSLELKVQNNLEGENVRVREENVGISRNLTTLKPRATYTLCIDPNATYREYTLITLPNQMQLPPLTTDLIQDLKEIVVFKDGDTYKWKGTPRVAHTPATGRGGLKTKLQGFFSKS